MVRLTGTLHRALCDTVLDNFSRDELRALLRHSLDLHLDHLASQDQGLEAVVPDLLDKLERRGRLEDFLAAVERERGPRPEVAAVLVRVRAGLGPRPAGQPRGPFLVPFPRNPGFVGRNADLDALHARLTEAGPVGIRPAGLTGMGGIGKTQLAVEYAYRRREDYPDGVFWLNAAEPLPQAFARLALVLRDDVADRAQDRQVRAAFEELHWRPRSLVVLDNLAQPAALHRPVVEGCLPVHLPGWLLFTTRQHDLGGLPAVEVTVLPEGPALDLLLRHPARQAAREAKHPEHADALAVVRMLGGLPLALEIAGAFLGEYPEIPLADFRGRLRREGALAAVEEEAGQLPEMLLPADHRDGLRVALTAQWEMLTGPDGETARQLLRVAGHYPEAAAIPVGGLGLLAGVAATAGPGKASPLARGLKRLRGASLAETLTGERLRLHPLVREFALGLVPADAAASFRQTCAVRLAEAYRDCAAAEEQARHRGVQALREDLLTALAFCPEEILRKELRDLLRAFQREEHHLAGWDRSREPALFAQQVHNRAALAGLEPLRASAARRLAEGAGPALPLVWAACRESPALERTLLGHDGIVRAVAVTATGDRAVSASGDLTLRVWDLATGQQLHTLAGHEDGVAAVALTAAGDRAVSGSFDQTVRVWDLTTGRLLHTLRGHEDRVGAVAVTAAGDRAVSASADGSLCVWDLGDGRLLHTLRGHEGGVEAVAVTAAGERAVSASVDRTLCVWDLSTGQLLHALRGHQGPVNAVAVTPAGDRAVSASDDGTVGVWDLAAGRLLHTLRGHEAGVETVAVTPAGDRIVSGAKDHTLRVWDPGPGKEVHCLRGHEDDVRVVTLTAAGDRAVSASDDGTARVWDLTVGREVLALHGHEKNLTAVAVAAVGDRAVSASYDHTLRVWDLAAGTMRPALRGHTGSVQAVALTPRGDRAVSTAEDRTLRVWDMATGQEVWALQGHTYGTAAVAVTPDGGRILADLDLDAVGVWDLVTGQPRSVLRGHRRMVSAVAVTPRGDRAVSASWDGTLRVWDLGSGRVLQVLRGHADSVYAVAVTPTGDCAVSGGADRALRIWDLEAGRPLGLLPGHTDRVMAVAVAPVGKVAVSASWDRTVRVWDLRGGRCLHKLEGHEGRVDAVAVTPAGDRVVSASWDGTLRVWDLATGQARHVLRGHRGRFMAVVLTPAGDRAVSASWNYTVRVWDLGTGRPQAVLRLDSVVARLAVTPDGRRLLAGDGAGSLFCFHLPSAGPFS